MSIIIYQGNPGSGKTYDAVRKVIANLAKGRRVLTNIEGLEVPFSNEVVKHICNLDDFNFDKQLILLSKEDVPRFWEIAQVNDLIVIDEAAKFFNARKWQTKKNENFTLWADEHRHNGQDILLLATKAKKIESGVRDIADWIYHYRKVNMFGSLISRKYMRFAYADGDTDSIGKVTRTYDPIIFKCYKSYFVKDAKEVGIQKGTNVLKHPIFIVLIVVLIAFFISLSKSSFFGFGIFGKDQAVAEEIKTNIKKSDFVRERDVVAVSDKVENYADKISTEIIGTLNGKNLIKTDKGIIFE